MPPQMRLTPKLAGLVLHTNCRFKAHVHLGSPALSADIAQTLEYRIGWLHSKAGHKLDCQRKFSTMYQSGWGRCVGENMELLWVSGDMGEGVGACFGQWHTLWALSVLRAGKARSVYHRSRFTTCLTGSGAQRLS